MHTVNRAAFLRVLRDADHKETSMASVLPVIELTKLGNQIYAKTYHPFEIYISLGVLYFVMTYSMTFVARKLERKATKWQ